MAKASKFPREKILTSILSLEANKGHLKWKVSDLARMAKVSRPLIYFHLGRTKKEILENCLGILGEEFYGLSPARENMMKEGKGLESLILTHRMFLTTPALAVLYLRSRNVASPLQRNLIALEQRYAEKIAKALPHLTAPEVRAVHAIFHGLVTAPFADEETLTTAWRMLGALLQPPGRR